MAVPFLSTSTASLDQSMRFLFRLNTSSRLVLLHEEVVSLFYSVLHQILLGYKLCKYFSLKIGQEVATIDSWLHPHAIVQVLKYS